jgi:DNA-binding CsgD family transcriptional regulator
MGHQIDTRSGGEVAWCGDFAEHLYSAPFRSAVFVGDVAGRGPAVGRAAGALRAYVRSVLLSGIPLADCLSAIDNFFARSVLSEMVPFASLFVAVTDTREAKLCYASAGHEPGLLFNNTGGHRHLEPTGPVLGLGGLLARSAFGERALPLVRGELLVVVTDGITEARRLDGGKFAFFGSTGVVRAVHAARRSLHDTAEAIHKAALEHARGAILDDASVAVSTYEHHWQNDVGPMPQRSLEGWSTLTKAEQRVAYLIANGHSNRAVATKLVVSQSTVATHARSIFSKLGVASRVQLALVVMSADGIGSGSRGSLIA